MARNVLKVGRFYINPQQQLLLDENKNEIALEAKVQEILFYLFDNRDRYVSLEELHENVWSGRIVSDSAVRRTISKLRKLFDDNGEEAEYIKSVVKKGYKFVCDVEESVDNEIFHEEKSKKVQGRKFTFSFKLFFKMIIFSLLIAFILFLSVTTFFKIMTLAQDDILALDQNEYGDYTYIGYEASEHRYQLFYRPSGTKDDQQLIFSSEPLINPIFIDKNIYVGLKNSDFCGLKIVSVNDSSTNNKDLHCYSLTHLSKIDSGELLITMQMTLGGNYQSYIFDIKDESIYALENTVNQTPYIAALSKNKSILAIATSHKKGSSLRLLDMKNRLQLKQKFFNERVVQIRWNKSTLILATEYSTYSLNNSTGVLDKFDVRTNVASKTRILDFSLYGDDINVLNDADLNVSQYLNTYIKKSGQLKVFNTVFLDSHMLPVLNTKDLIVDYQDTGYVLKFRGESKALEVSDEPFSLVTQLVDKQKILIVKKSNVELIDVDKGTLQYKLDIQGEVKQVIDLPSEPALWLIVKSQFGWQTLLWKYHENKLSTIALNERLRFLVNNDLYWIDSESNRLLTKNENGDTRILSNYIPITPDSLWVLSDDGNLFFSAPTAYGSEIYSISLKNGSDANLELRVRDLVNLGIDEKGRLVVVVEKRPKSQVSSSFRLFGL